MLLDDETEAATQSLRASHTPTRGVLQAAGRWIRGVRNRIGLLTEWLFGLGALVIGLSILAALPVAQFLSLGYFLESSARVARSGRLRDGFIGIRTSARFGSAAIGASLSLLPLWLVQSFAASAALIAPGGAAFRALRITLFILAVLTFIHVGVACARGGRLRSFLWPPGNYLWLLRRLRRGGLYTQTRDAFWNTLTSLRLPRFFRIGLVGYLGALAWLIVPGLLITMGGRYPLASIVGAALLALIVPFLPFLQVGYAVENRVRALFDRKSIRDRFRRAPWAFAFALFVLLLASIPLYLLKIEMIPRDAAWLPCLVFVIFLAPARPLIGWAYARSERRSLPRHWIFRLLGRLAIIPVALLYVLVVLLAQYTSWTGSASLFDQHAFLLPVPFQSMGSN
jgi:hypothetical protein